MKTLSIIILLCITFSSYAQDSNTLKVKETFPLLHANIAKNASKEWPSDYVMQKYLIEQQSVAFYKYLYMDLDHLPEGITGDIRTSALEEWAKNWLNCLEKASDTDAFFACYNADWQMVVYVMEEQIKAYNSLKN